MEMNCGRMLHDLNIPYKIKPAVLEKKIAAIEKKDKIELDKMQKDAVFQAVQNGIMIITGGPGTGKTTTIVGNKNDQEKAGYYGEKIVLKCQKLGLNTCWVAMTHGKSKAQIKRGQKLLIIISLGYGETQGVPHKSKSIAELGQADQKNEWFEKGMEAVSLAPTAVNQQKFYFELKNGIVTAKNLGGFYSRIDLGIVKYHFEAVTGHEVK